VRLGVASAALAVLAAAGACSGSGVPAISPMEARHLHAYDISAHNMDNTLQPGDVVVANDADLPWAGQSR